ncbi:3-keto-5-aminohexanoate cleavage protein [Actinokineospora auranticolor]|uniref:Uncharacterized protein (DUF849 family) n=1 Tax=Actinokineospora auranticolor TaxID=155976 RepID=A0A2S6GGF4_9PSEU|nr:3-keto-5-aminohexanoate cleavage protein [Actinokineospora auranticolor]PPK64292.1 uncharacterized protein (DUF849 family) [Actinokineospora auranticolor]
MPRTVQACLNGTRSTTDHPAVPITGWQVARAAAEVAELGVDAVHLHPRDAAGAETLVGSELAGTVAAVRAVAPAMAVGVTTGAWIVPDPRRRAALVAGWVALAAGRPDFASVNVHEPGWWEVCAAAHEAGVEVELGVYDPGAARTLRDRGLPPGAVRVLAEVQPTEPGEAAEAAGELLDALSWVTLPVLLHGEGDSAWTVLAEANNRGLATRIGLEDTLDLPDGTRAPDNTALVRAALDA